MLASLLLLAGLLGQPAIPAAVVAVAPTQSGLDLTQAAPSPRQKARRERRAHRSTGARLPKRALAVQYDEAPNGSASDRPGHDKEVAAPNRPQPATETPATGRD